jgi:hypothetical protein
MNSNQIILCLNQSLIINMLGNQTKIRRKTSMFYLSLWLKFSRKQHLSLKSHETLVVNDKGYWMKEKVNKYKVILWLHCIHIVTCDYNATILVTIEANDVLPRVLILNYYYYYYYYYEIIYDTQFKCLDDLTLWHVAQCKYAMWHLKMNLIQNINIMLAGA